MKRIASASFLAALAVATVYGKPVTGSSSASSSISIEEMSSSDIEKAFVGSGFGAGFGGKGFSFGQGVTSYTGKPSVVLKECCVYPPIGTNIPRSATFDRLFKYRRKGYFTATYIVLAQNIVDIDLENLVVESITDGSGKDYTKKKNGDANWEAEPFFSSVNREAGFATFML